MKYNASTLGRRAAAAAGVLTLAVLGLAPMAQAENANHGDINTEALGSLTIHKHLTGDGNPIGAPDGTASNDDGKGAPVSGVQFTAYEINGIDLKTSEGWAKVNALTNTGAIPDNACANPEQPTLPNYTFRSSRVSGDTDRDGQAKIESLPVKAYLVCETKTPGNIVQKAKPFVVTIPHPNTAAKADGTWLYDVHVYPKNEKIEVAKTIEDQRNNGYVVGSKVRFPVSSTLPKLDDNSYYKYYQFKDTLDNRLKQVTATDVTLGGTQLNGGPDYTLGTDGQTVTVTFTQNGLNKLKDNPGQKLQAVFEGVVSEAGDGSINNTAQLISDTTYAEQPPAPETPPANPDNPPTTEQVTSKWGDLTIKKVDGNDRSGDKDGLKGAEFQIYKAKDAYADTCSPEADGQPLTINGESTFTTGEGGTINFKALFVSDSVQDTGRDNRVDAPHRCYVLVETKAPAGYVLPADASRAITVEPGAGVTQQVVIDNVKQSVPGLPLTGANGMLILTASGAALLMIAVGSVLVARYRERKRNADLAA
ncbi:SpaH/EbpB family LPXTG-anchored major pilin [Actinomyces naeslundii]|uniref:SpaH/EbpB family LPXTG-anchored major pilin n=1 Tax=Actinomyces naeslundii TaxID=1655 RepID=UPI003FA1628D